MEASTVRQSRGVIDYYRGKNVLLTGTTGFIGKVMLEKYLRYMPEIGTLYIMIRKKKGLHPMERFKKEILGSQCFDKVRKLYPNFDEFINTHVKPVSGDLLEENLGLDPKDRLELTQNLHIIINCAASVDFNSRLDEAIKINVYGTLKIFQLAKDTKNIENFIHVSTAYVNSDKRGLIQEKVYEINVDAEEYISQLSKKPVNEIVAETPKILGGFPNTYTFTKSMCERILEKKRGDLSLTIIRPSIVGAAWKDPCIGWLDTVTAASAIYLLSGLGIMKSVEGDRNCISDQIPVDHIGDMVIAAGAALANKNKLTVLHAGSSSKNPVTWGLALDTVKHYWQAHLPEKRVGPPGIRVFKNPRTFKLYTSAQAIPVHMYKAVAYTVGGKSMKKNADKMSKMVERTRVISGLYKAFSMNEWVFVTEKIEEVKRFCTPQERKIFLLDIAEVDWKKYLQYFAWGLHRFVLKENPDYPTAEPENMDILGSINRGSNFEDLRWALQKGHEFKPRQKAQMKSLVVSSPRVQGMIQELVANRKNKGGTAEQFKEQLTQKAYSFCDTLFSTYSMTAIRVACFLINKVFRQMFEKIVFDENSLSRLQKIDYKTQGPIVLMPTHRSFVDFVLVSYILFSYKLKCPHIAAQEEFLDIALLHIIFRASGAFFLRKKKVEHKELYDTILYEYIQRLLIDESWLEFFIEGTRSRYGKIQLPKQEVLPIITDTYFDKKVPDIQIIPVTINYDRVVEADTFPYELLGEEKLKLSLIKFLGAYKIFSMNFGRVYVNFCEPISIKEYTEKFNTRVPKPIDPFTKPKDREILNKSFSLDVLKIITDNIVIMPTSLIASILLMHRKGINDEQLTQKVDWLIQEVKLRGGKLAGDIASIAVKNGLTHLDHLLERKKDIFHPSFSAKTDYKNIILLSYYKNALGHLFFNEAIIACSLVAYGYELAWKEGVPRDRLWEKTKYLQGLIGKEYLTSKKIGAENFDQFLELMMKRKTLMAVDGKIKVAPEGEQLVNFLCSLLWPFIESYWVTSVFLYTLKNRDKDIPLDKFESEVQSFAESMYEERTIEFYEACAIDTIRNALNCAKDQGLIKSIMKFDEEAKEETEYISLNNVGDLLKESIFYMQSYLKNSLANTVDLPISITRKSILVDFPFMSKL